MKFRNLLIFLCCSLLIASFALSYAFLIKETPRSDQPDVFVGVDVAHDAVAEIIRLVDEISVYTNLLVIGCRGIS